MKFLALLFMSGCCMVSSAADKPILIVTPQGVWQINIVDGVPQAPVAADITVIVQGFGDDPAPKPPDPPVPPINDTVVDKVAELSYRPFLANRNEATACAALIDTLRQAGLSGESLKKAVTVAAAILDGQLKASGRVKTWAESVLAVTTDASKIKEGLSKAWSLTNEVYTALDATSSGREMTTAESEAVGNIDFAQIMQWIMTIVTILQQMGLIK